MSFHSSKGRLLSCLALFSIVMSGCADAGPQRAAIEGHVTFGGQPLKSGRILFLPLSPTEGPVTSLTVAQGKYQADHSTGPLVGAHRVEVEAALDLGFPLDDEEAFIRRGRRPLPGQSVPPEFNRDSQLSVTIEDGKVNRYDVAIPASMQSAGY